MKLTKLTIAPDSSWHAVGADNPLRAVVKLDGDKSTVEVVLSDESMKRMLDLVAVEIAEQARQRVNEFAAAVTAVEGDRTPALLGAY